MCTRTAFSWMKSKKICCEIYVGQEVPALQRRPSGFRGALSGSTAWLLSNHPSCFFSPPSMMAQTQTLIYCRGSRLPSFLFLSVGLLLKSLEQQYPNPMTGETAVGTSVFIPVALYRRQLRPVRGWSLAHSQWRARFLFCYDGLLVEPNTFWWPVW